MLCSVLRASELCLPSQPGLRFVRRWREKGSGCQAQAGRCRWRWGSASSWSSSRLFATHNLANFLRPLAPGRRTIRLLGCRSDSCQRGRSFWEPRSEGETCGKETGQRWVSFHSGERGHPERLWKGPFLIRMGTVPSHSVSTHTTAQTRHSSSPTTATTYTTLLPRVRSASPLWHSALPCAWLFMPPSRATPGSPKGSHLTLYCSLSASGRGGGSGYFIGDPIASIDLPRKPEIVSDLGMWAEKRDVLLAASSPVGLVSEKAGWGSKQTERARLTNWLFSGVCLLCLPGFPTRVVSGALGKRLGARVEVCVGGESGVNWVPLGDVSGQGTAVLAPVEGPGLLKEGVWAMAGLQPQPT